MAFRFEIKQLADYEKYVLAPFLRRYVFLYFVAEKHHSDFILVLDGGEGKGGGDFRDELALHRAYRTEIAAVGNVDKQQHGQLALLFVDLYEGLAAACGDIPVDVAYLVAILIFAHFRECHTASFERGVVFSGEYVLRQTACLDFNLPDFS